MNRERFAVVLVVVLVAGSGLAAIGPASGLASTGEHRATVTLTVTVTDSPGNAIDDAELTATWDGGSSTATTASNGKAFLDVEEGADVAIDVEHSGYTLNNPVIVEDASEQDVAIEVFLKSNLEVTVTSGQTAVDGADVVVRKEGESRAAATGTTNANGVFESGTIEKGTYSVFVVEEGYLRNETFVDVSGDTRTTVRLEEGIATVTLSVQDDHFDSPKPIEGASITVEGPTGTTETTTTGTGKRTLGLPANAEFTITVTKDGYTTSKRTVNIGQQDRTLTFNIERKPSLSVDAVNQRVVVGENVQLTVTDEYGERVAGATVSVDGETVGETNAEGIYKATIDSSGEHTITVESDGVSGSVTVEGVAAGSEETPAGTATEEPEGTGAPIGDFSQPDRVMKIGVAAIGVLLAFIVVRRLL